MKNNFNGKVNVNMEFLRGFLQHSLGVLLEEVFIILLVIALSVLSKYIMKSIYKQVKKIRGHDLPEKFISKALKPIYIMIWLIGFSYLIYVFIVRLQMQNDFESSFSQFRNMVIIICMTWFAFEIKSQVQYCWLKKGDALGHADHTNISLISKLASFTIILIALLILLDTLGVRLGALIALGGVGGITIGFAARDVFANFFSGMMIHITRPFNVGDWIFTQDQTMEGVVEHIGFYITKFMGMDKQPFYVPNSLFSSKVIVNATRMTHRRFKHTIGLRYEDFDLVEKVIKDLQHMIDHHPDVDPNMQNVVDLVEFSESSLDLLVTAYTKKTAQKEWLYVQKKLLMEIGRIVSRHGAEMAFTTSTVYLYNKKD